MVHCVYIIWSEVSSAAQFQFQTVHCATQQKYASKQGFSDMFVHLCKLLLCFFCISFCTFFTVLLHS